MATHNYSLRATVVDPKIDAELRYVLSETREARQRLQRAGARWWPPFSYPSAGILRKRDWQKYVDALELYNRQLLHHQNELKEGLIPFSVLVSNISGANDARVKIRLEVEDGFIDVHKKPLMRPKRIDGAPDYVANKLHFRMNQISNFIRWHIQITRQRVEAEFSALADHDSAVLVIPVLYLSTTKNTRMTYMIQSRNVEGQERGQVLFQD